MPEGQSRKFGQDDWRADAVAAVGEFLGTFTFLFFGLGGIQTAATTSSLSASGADNSFLLMASASMGLSLVFSVWIFFRVTGAAFNPNIALTLVLLKVISPLRFVMYFIAQLLGGIAAAAVLQGLLPGDLLVNCQPSNKIGTAQALFYEMFLTFGLCMTVVMLAVDKNKSTPLTPLAIGLALFSSQLAGIFWTGAAVNTARAFGPAVVTRTFVGTHWIYWVGPSLGAILAAMLHRSMHFFHYWELNPGADAVSKVEAEKQAARPEGASPIAPDHV